MTAWRVVSCIFCHVQVSASIVKARPACIALANCAALSGTDLCKRLLEKLIAQLKWSRAVHKSADYIASYSFEV